MVERLDKSQIFDIEKSYALMSLSWKIPWSSMAPLCLLLTAVAIRLYEPAIGTEYRLQIFDRYQQLSPRVPTDVPISIVDIDEGSLARIGQWPWSRQQLADLVDELTALGAAAIVFDVLFSEPDRLSPARLAELLPDGVTFDDARAKLRDLPDNDQAFASAIGNSNVAIGFALTHDPGPRLPKLKPRYATKGPAPDPYLLSFGGAITALPVLETSAAGYGYLTHTVGTDEVIRRLPLFVRIGETVYPSLVAEALRIAQGASNHATKTADPASGNTGRTGLINVRIGRLIVPTDPAGQIWIRYRNSVHTQAVPAWQVLSGEAQASQLSGRIVLVGSSAVGVGDFGVNALGELTSSLAVQAQAIETILAADYLTRPDWIAGAEMLFCLVLGAILIWVLPRWGMAWCAGLALLAIASVLAGGWIAFDRYRLLLDPMYPVLIVVLVYLSGAFSIYLTTRTRLIRTTWLVEHDVLTGCLSRRTWYDRAITNLEQCADRQGFLVAILDIDLFKKVNDTYGHVLGDEALKHMVNVVTQALGATGAIFGRLGGEEFGLALLIDPKDNTSTDSRQIAADLLERVRLQLEESPLPISPIADDGNHQSIALTTSIGATFPTPLESLGDAINRADKALYSAKESGRNRVVFG
jgi:diguanylate cyclase (GGDEF)-like protein